MHQKLYPLMAAAEDMCVFYIDGGYMNPKTFWFQYNVGMLGNNGSSLRIPSLWMQGLWYTLFTPYHFVVHCTVVKLKWPQAIQLGLWCMLWTP
jgi:hypothetical protein